MFRYDRERSRSGSPKRKEYSREERKNGKKKDRRCWICLKHPKAVAFNLIILGTDQAAPGTERRTGGGIINRLIHTNNEFVN